MPTKKTIFMADCGQKEIEPIIEAFTRDCGLEIELHRAISNMSHGSKTATLRRYISYFTLPLKLFFRRKHYEEVIGWQQFHALNYALYCRLFHVKKRQHVFAINFTYKEKNGIIGKIYRKYMAYALTSKHLDLIHAPSNAYADETCRTFNIPRDKVAVATFGTNDHYEEWRQLPSPVEGQFVLSIGRSNRNFDWLVEVWRTPELNSVRLVIISDTWQPQYDLPENVIHLDNITGNASFPYISNCILSVVPIDNPVLCSGDTVLLNSMMMRRPVAVTAPSTLAEMYVEDGINGIHLSREVASAAEKIRLLLSDPERLATLSENARQSYKEHFSREALGRNLAAAFAKVMAKTI